MKKLFLAAVVFTACLPLNVAGQDTSALKDFSRVLNGPVQLTLVHVNAKTLPVLFKPPTIYSIRARAREGTLIYVQGTAPKDVDLDTSGFTLEQGGESVPGTAQNIKNFQGGKVPKGERIDGLVLFVKQIDPAKPFTIKHGKDSVEFKFSNDQVKAMAPPPAAAP